MRIAVTQEHIDNGIRYSYTSCPIALALKDTGFKDVSVGCFSIDLRRPWHTLLQHVQTTQAMREFMLLFDSGLTPYGSFGTAQPTEFELDV